MKVPQLERCFATGQNKPTVLQLRAQNALRTTWCYTRHVGFVTEEVVVLSLWHQIWLLLDKHALF